MAPDRLLAQGTIFLFLSVLLLAIIQLPVVKAQSRPVINVRWVPAPVTPNDTFSIDATVTSPIGIRNVTLYFRIGPSGLSLSSSSDYTKIRMDGPFSGNNTNGLWSHDFQPQPNGTVIYFLVEAFDVEDMSSIWPDNFPPFQYPFRITVEFPSKPYLSDVYFTLNSLTISDLVQQANVTVTAAAYFPKIPEFGYVQVDVASNGPYRNRFPFFTMQYQSTRFYYSGQAWWWVDLRGSPNQIPYDTYTISLNVTFPYHFDNLSLVANSTPVWLFSSTDIWNSWLVPQPAVVWYSVGNVTVLRMDSTLSRRIPTYYPPLVLMLVAFAILGLIPLVSVYYHDKRYDLFLNVIILASSAELSQTLYPAVGFQGDNIFLESFAFILIGTVFMMTISSLPENVRGKSFWGFQLEFYAAVVTVFFATAIISTTNFPIMAKWITPFAGGSGAILGFAYVYAPRLWLTLRRSLRGISRMVKKWLRGYVIHRKS